MLAAEIHGNTILRSRSVSLYLACLVLAVIVLGNSFFVKGLATCVVASGLPRAGGHDRRFCFVRDLAACVTAPCLPSVGDHDLRLTSCRGCEAYVPTSGLPHQCWRR